VYRDRNQEKMTKHLDLAESVRQRCIEAAQEAYDDAGLRGLCLEGRWECAIGAIRSLDIGSLAEGLEGECDA
jgi:hypothetical protein